MHVEVSDVGVEFFQLWSVVQSDFNRETEMKVTGRQTDVLMFLFVFIIFNYSALYIGHMGCVFLPCSKNQNIQL